MSKSPRESGKVFRWDLMDRSLIRLVSCGQHAICYPTSTTGERISSRELWGPESEWPFTQVSASFSPLHQIQSDSKSTPGRRRLILDLSFPAYVNDGSPRRVPPIGSVSGRCSSVDSGVGCGCIHGQVGHQAGLPQCTSAPAGLVAAWYVRSGKASTM